MKNLVRCGIAALMMFGACQAMASSGSYELGKLRDNLFVTRDDQMIVVTSSCSIYFSSYQSVYLNTQAGKVVFWNEDRVCSVSRVINKAFTFVNNTELKGEDGFYDSSGERAYIKSGSCRKSVSGEKVKISNSGTRSKMIFSDGTECWIDGIYRYRY